LHGAWFREQRLARQLADLLCVDQFVDFSLRG
jgi:hypothetical protein